MYVQITNSPCIFNYLIKIRLKLIANGFTFQNRLEIPLYSKY